MNSEQLPEIAENIISQADKWTFEGDCMILKWMEQISQNLEIRAKTTTESLDKLQKNFNRAQIALENTQNSLMALQYTQYVEMRCQDDETPLELETNKEQPIRKSADEILKTFLQNNLKMLNNCHDKFNFVEDSDDEDNATAAENCIYQPRNPYNDRLLPHIFGTKMWKENWHVGLCDDTAADYSGDEASEVYSISSASSGGNGSIESHNTASLSQWASSASLNNENIQKPIGAIATTAIPQPPVITTPKLPAIDLVSPKLTHMPSDSSSDSLGIVDHTPTPIETKEPEMASSSKKKPLQCKTLNLFDDNDFNSLMSEIVDKANIKSGASNESPSRTSATFTSNSLRKEAKIDLFGEGSISDIPALKVVPPISKNGVEKKISTTTAKVSKTETEKLKEKEKPKTKTLNLFDSPTEDSKFDFFKTLDEDVVDRSKPAKVESTTSASIAPTVRTKISAKSLFDDDDGDDDFLNLFGKGKQKTPSSVGKESLSEDYVAKTSTKTMFDSLSLFDEDDLKNDQTLTTKKPRPSVEVPRNAEIFKEPVTVEPKVSSPPKDIQINQISKPLFFDDDYEDDMFSKKSVVQVNEINKSLPAYLTTEPPEDTVEHLKSKKDYNVVTVESDSDDEWFNTLDNKSKSKLKNEPNKTFDKTTETFPTEVSKSSSHFEPEVSMDEPIETFDKTVEIFPTEVSTQSSYFEGKDNIEPVKNVFAQQLAAENSEVTSKPTQDEEKISSEADAIVNETVNTNASPAVEVEAISVSKQIPNEINEIKQLDQDNNTHKPLIVEEQNQNTVPEQSVEIISPPPEFPEELQSNNLNATATNTDKQINSPAFDNYSALFLDEPPDDDFFQAMGTVSQTNIENDFFDPPAFKEKETITTDTKVDESQRSSIGYNIGLFSDLPPEDEGEKEDLEKTASTNSSPTLNDSKSSTKIKPTAFINELPPTDDSFEKETTKNHSAVNKDVPDRKATTVEVSTSKDVSPDNTNDLKTNTISKLKMPKININVQALLPNAGGGKPKFRNTDVEQQSSNEQNVSTISKSTINIPSTQSETAVEEQNRPDLLPNLCKNRVRVPVKRKSSTRAARKESYHKSLMLAQEEERKSEIVINEPQPQQNVINVKKVESNTESLSQKSTKSVKEINSPKPDRKTGKSKSNRIVGGNKMFDESDENSDDDFFSKLAKAKIPGTTPNIASTSKNQSLSKTEPDNDSDEDLFRSDAAVIVVKSAPQISQVLNKTQNSPKPMVENKKLSALFADKSNEDDDDDDDLFASLSKPKTTFPPPNKVPTLGVPKKVPAKPKDSNKSLFSDSEDDDDDLFGNVTTKPKNVTAVSGASAIPKSTMKPKNTSTQGKAPIIKSTDNPLADLLDP